MAWRTLDECDVDGIGTTEEMERKILLVGEPDSKRTLYFQKAAREKGACVELLPWERVEEGSIEFSERAAEEFWVKLDPMKYQSGKLSELNDLLWSYQERLAEWEKLPFCYLNSPQSIAQLLNKETCKQTLKKAGCAVTTSFGLAPQTLEAFLEYWEKIGNPPLFLKPLLGSGAAGVTALRRQKRRNKMVLYSCAVLEKTEKGERLLNSKRLQRLEEEAAIRSYLRLLLPLCCQAEYWYPKEKYGEYSYDLRAVFQFGHLDFLLARLSKGPITNLQLNNHPLPFEELGLTKDKVEEIEELCRQAVACFSGLNSVGIDILLERGSKTPRIIEMNGQGDLIYQDIYRENRIYKRQIDGMNG